MGENGDMIRMVFYPELDTDEAKLLRMVAKLAPLQCRTLIKPDCRNFIFIETSQFADNLAYQLKAKNYIYCKGCNSLHFKTEHTCKDAFICMCGMTLNKLKL